MWNPSAKEIKAVTQLSPFERYTYSVKKIADNEPVCTIGHNDGSWAISKLDEHNIISIWPHADFAKSELLQEWQECEVLTIPLTEFMEFILHDSYTNTLISVFDINGHAGFVVSQEELLRDLREELNNY